MSKIYWAFTASASALLFASLRASLSSFGKKIGLKSSSYDWSYSLEKLSSLY
jgi:hypothetical protein